MTNDLTVLAMNEVQLQNFVLKEYGMEVNEKKSKKMRVSSQPTPSHITMAQKQLESVQQFKYLGKLVTDDEYLRKRSEPGSQLQNPEARKGFSLLDIWSGPEEEINQMWTLGFVGFEAWMLWKKLKSF